MSPIRAVAVFCGSKTGNDPAFAGAASRLGSILAEEQVRLVYGGGGIGLMGILADAVLAGGGQVTGVIPEFLMKHEVGKRDLSEMVIVPSMHDRKHQMFERADGFVVLPGGIGTLEEAIEIITWKQLQLHAKPVAVIDIAGYWAPLAALVRQMISAGFAHPGVLDLFTLVDDADSVLDALANAPAPDRAVLTSHF
jgi:uncharacterized protein (TIGR00730 family)